MKFSASRKINLANIDSTLWPFETEEVVVEGADSPEEAFQMLDRVVAERTGVYKGRADMARNTRGTSVVARPSHMAPPPPPPAPVPASTAQPQVVPGTVVAGQPGAVSAPQPSAVVSEPPAEFKP